MVFSCEEEEEEAAKVLVELVLKDMFGGLITTKR
jgi:hypothetical protein